MTALISAANLVSQPIGEGDAGIILRKDGSFQIFNTHENIDSENLTERQVQQGEILMAFAVAMQIPDVMKLLVNISKDPEVISTTINTGTLN
jgi:hypothetical protein